MMIDILLDTVMDCLKLVPFLLITYLAMEFLENKTSDKTKHAIEKSGKFGPLIGGLVGAVPQCGFSAAASICRKSYYIRYIDCYFPVYFG
jgi:hypothetical protein